MCSRASTSRPTASACSACSSSGAGARTAPAFPKCASPASPCPGSSRWSPETRELGELRSTMRFAELVETSRRVAATRSRLEKVAHLSEVIQKLPPELVGIGTSYLAGDLPQGRLGIGYAVFGSLRDS